MKGFIVSQFWTYVVAIVAVIGVITMLFLSVCMLLPLCPLGPSEVGIQNDRIESGFKAGNILNIIMEIRISENNTIKGKLTGLTTDDSTSGNRAEINDILEKADRYLNIYKESGLLQSYKITIDDRITIGDDEIDSGHQKYSKKEIILSRDNNIKLKVEVI